MLATQIHGLLRRRAEGECPHTSTPPAHMHYRLRLAPDSKPPTPEEIFSNAASQVVFPSHDTSFGVFHVHALYMLRPRDVLLLETHVRCVAWSEAWRLLLFHPSTRLTASRPYQRRWDMIQLCLRVQERAT